MRSFSDMANQKCKNYRKFYYCVKVQRIPALVEELTKKIVKQNFRIKYLPVGEKRTITCLSSSVVYDMTVTTRIHSVM